MSCLSFQLADLLSLFITPDNRFQCLDCNMVFKYKPGIYKHVNHGRCKKLKKTAEKHECGICHKVFPRYDRLKSHIEKHNKALLICPKCYMEYKRQDHFDKHILAYTDVLPSFLSETAFSIDECNVEDSVPVVDNLEIEDEGPIVCPIVFQSPKNKSSN